MCAFCIRIAFVWMPICMCVCACVSTSLKLLIIISGVIQHDKDTYDWLNNSAQPYMEAMVSIISRCGLLTKVCYQWSSIVKMYATIVHFVIKAPNLVQKQMRILDHCKPHPLYRVPYEGKFGKLQKIYFNGLNRNNAMKVRIW